MTEQYNIASLIARLRKEEKHCASVYIIDNAIETIERLVKERDELRQQVENIKNGFEGGCYLCEVVGEMNKRLQKERDEARRMYCTIIGNSASQYGTTAKGVAKQVGWDCFKEETQ